MRRVLLTIIFFIGLLWGIPVFAHQPAKMDLKYDEKTNMLKIDLTHVTQHTRTHYIRRVMVFKNEEKVEEFFYSAQKNPQGLSLEVRVEAKSGDQLRVKAICKEAGFKEEKYLLP